MQITLYRRSFPVADAPVALSFARDPAGQRHTFVVGGRVYEAERRELQVIVPNGATIDAVKNRLCWASDKGPVKSTAKEVFDLAEALLSGFQLVE
jgi:hypothetical protein